MTAPFALQFTQPRKPEPVTPFTYDPERQLSVCPDGSPAATAYPILLRTETTSSTAGSATHNDDD
ncbi:putative ATP-grasp-modified RiPP [Streptomyces sp. DT224]|uniref:putative ATP-grasp-modified RiPP n=1 Tax=Streptomyces sp. DT224 TaxID=3393426 RepID=UPI003CEB5889